LVGHIEHHMEDTGRMADTLTAIVAGHKQSQINDLLPWNYPK